MKQHIYHRRVNQTPRPFTFNGDSGKPWCNQGRGCRLMFQPLASPTDGSTRLRPVRIQISQRHEQRGGVGAQRARRKRSCRTTGTGMTGCPAGADRLGVGTGSPSLPRPDAVSATLKQTTKTRIRRLCTPSPARFFAPAGAAAGLATGFALLIAGCSGGTRHLVESQARRRRGRAVRNLSARHRRRRHHDGLRDRQTVHQEERATASGRAKSRFEACSSCTLPRKRRHCRAPRWPGPA